MDDAQAGKLITYIKICVSRNELYGQVSDEIQGQQGDCPFLHDSGDVKAAGVLVGSCVCRTQYVHVMVPKIGLLYCSILQILKTRHRHYYKVKCLEVTMKMDCQRAIRNGKWGGGVM